MIPSKTDNVVYRKVAGETILVPVHGDVAKMKKIYILNNLGEFIWERIDGRKSVDEILDEIVENFEVTRDEARKDLNEFINSLKERNLVEEAP
ncbi:MAG: PqqD family protein [Nitrospirae bacterium]|nr:MAG: PqqD family protein [Nitrospirota bacterium]